MHPSVHFTIFSRTDIWRCATLWGGQTISQIRGEGPRPDQKLGFRSFAAQEDGQKVRLRAESFADHYSQARQFYLSQTETEQKHIAMALTFELSKVETPRIRERIVSHLLNIDATLAETVAGKLGIRTMPQAADVMVPVRDDLAPSPALSIIANGPGSFKGRKIGVLAANGSNAQVLDAIRQATEQEGATLELVAPTVGGFEASSGDWMEADHMIDGGPSVLFDAVALVLSEEAADRLTREAAARISLPTPLPIASLSGLPQARCRYWQRRALNPIWMRD